MAAPDPNFIVKDMEKKFCHLEKAAGRTVECPEEDCPFWRDYCVLADIRPDTETNPYLADFLLHLRRRVEGYRPLSDCALLLPGLH